MTPIRPLLTLALAAWMIFIAGGVITGAEPGFLVFFSVLVWLTIVITVAALGAATKGMASLYTGFPHVAEGLGGELIKNMMGEQQVSAPGPHGGRWIIELRSRRPIDGGPSRTTAVGWRANGHALPDREFLLGWERIATDDLPDAAIGPLDTLRAEAPEALLRVRPAGFFIREDEISLMWPGYITEPARLEALFVRSQDLLGPLIDALVAPEAGAPR